MSPRSRALAALLAGNILLAFGPWLVRLADTGPLATAGWRLALAAPLLVAIALARGGGRSLRGQPLLLAGLVVGGLFFAADLASWHAGILRTRLANSTLFGNMAGFLFPLYGFAVARRWPNGAQTITLLLALVGVALLLGRSLELSARSFAGDLLCMLAGLFYTVYLISIERARATLPPFASLAVVTLAGIAPLFLLAAHGGERVLPADWTPLVALAIGSQVLGQGLLVFSIGALDPLVVGLALLIQPVVSAAIGWRLYGERLGLLDIVGAVAIAAALVLVRREPARA